MTIIYSFSLNANNFSMFTDRISGFTDFYCTSLLGSRTIVT
ncbi:hypothetical protein [Xanthovirga aplysinae]|nr:hypothetical protein [Xanthovirga aplysinae]